jgi:hypothetical protein
MDMRFSLRGYGGAPSIDTRTQLEDGHAEVSAWPSSGRWVESHEHAGGGSVRVPSALPVVSIVMRHDEVFAVRSIEERPLPRDSRHPWRSPFGPTSLFALAVGTFQAPRTCTADAVAVRWRLLHTVGVPADATLWPFHLVKASRLPPLLPKFGLSLPPSSTGAAGFGGKPQLPSVLSSPENTPRSDADGHAAVARARLREIGAHRQDLQRRQRGVQMRNAGRERFMREFHRHVGAC